MNVGSGALISVVIPCYNEAEVIETMFRRVVAALTDTPAVRFELVFVDDGSTDDTPSILRRLHAASTHTHVVTLSRNFGHQLAATAGIEDAHGDAVVLIDADLQDPPEIIPQMIAKWKAGADVVYAVRAKRLGESTFKRSTAAIFYAALNRMSELHIPHATGDFRLMDRRVVEVLKAMPERDRFLRGMVAWIGFRQESITYERDPRFAGVTKYPLRKMMNLAIDGVSSFSIRPLRFASWCGFIAAFIAFLGMVYAIAARLMTNAWVPGWAALFVAVMFLGGIQLLSLGIIGEYIGRLFVQAKARPLFIVADRLEAGKHAPSEGESRSR